MSKSPEQKIYEFDEFRFDAEHLMLYRRDEALPLAPKAAETLLIFIEHRGEILTKDALIELIWPDSFVEESNLFLYLSVLRKTLGDQNNGKPYLETLRRRGYRFSANVRLVANGNGRNGTSVIEPAHPVQLNPPRPAERVQSATPLPHEPPDHTPADSLTWRKKVYALAGLIGLIAAVWLGYSYLFNKGQIKSIAVIPFQNDDPELDYLSDGMTYSINESLLKLPELDVKANSTMFRYKGTTLDAASIGRELDVDAVLSPRMVPRGEDLTLYLELVDPRTENSLWQQRYSRKTSQIGVLQRDIIRDVLRELKIDLTDASAQRIARNYTENAEATRLYYRGAFHARKLNERDIRQGIAYLWQAIEHDPSYAPAYAMIANGHHTLSLCCDVRPSELAQAKTAAEKALELDPELAEAHSALAASLDLHDWNFAEAEKHHLRALELDPESAIAHSHYSDFLMRMGRVNESRAHRERAKQLEPLSPFINAFSAFDTDPDKRLENARFAIELDPNLYMSYLAAASAYQDKKMFPEALAQYRRAKEVAPEQTWSEVNYSRMLKEMGEIGQVRAMLDELLRRSESRYVPPFHIATICNQLGDTEQALAWLEKGYQERDPKMTFLKTRFRNLHEDPRFQDLLLRVGF